MRYPVAIICGAFLAVLPLLIVVFPEFAWHVSCWNVLENPPPSWIVGGFLENQCEVTDGPAVPLYTQLLVLGILAAGCAIAGAMAARIAEERPLLIAFLAPALGYSAVFLVDGFQSHVLALGVLAGLLGIFGATWKYLTNAWSATRSKQRASQA